MCKKRFIKVNNEEIKKEFNNNYEGEKQGIINNFKETK